MTIGLALVGVFPTMKRSIATSPTEVPQDRFTTARSRFKDLCIPRELALGLPALLTGRPLAINGRQWFPFVNRVFKAFAVLDQ